MKFRISQPKQDDVIYAWLEVNENGNLKLIMQRNDIIECVLYITEDCYLHRSCELPNSLGLSLNTSGRIQLLTEHNPPAQPEKGP